MLRFVIFLSVAALASGFVLRPRVHAIAPRSPVGECPGHQEGPPTYLPDSEKCDIYYECSNGDPVQNFCTGGLEWNPTLNTCDFPDHANCQAGKPKQAPKKTHPFSAVGSCPPHEDGTPTYLEDDEDCQKYYECNNGIAVQNVCPDDLQWNPVLHVCDFPNVVDCHKGEKHLKTKAVQHTVAPRSPLGECPGHQEGPPTYLPDSERCDIYYECSNGDAVQNYCTAGLEWNPVLNTCDFPDHANCQAGKPKKAPKAVHPFSPVGECPGHQEGPPTYLPDSEKCDVYYECSNGLPIQNHCADGLEWNPTLNTCDFPDHANCQAGKPKKDPTVVQPFSPEGECHGHEDGTPTYLPDSNDCQIYYECNNGIPVPNVCPGDLQWNTVLHVCDFPQVVQCVKSR